MALSGFVSVDSEDLEGVLTRLVGFLEPNSPGMQALLEEAARRIENITVLRYPDATGAPLPRRYRWGGGVHKFPSLRAQRGFFARLRRGEINVPYRRTGTLARALKFKIAPDGEGVTLLASVPEKPYKWIVGNKSQQSHYFKNLTKWRPLGEMLQDQESEYLQAAEVVFSQLAEQLGV